MLLYNSSSTAHFVNSQSCGLVKRKTRVREQLTCSSWQPDRGRWLTHTERTLRTNTNIVVAVGLHVRQVQAGVMHPASQGYPLLAGQFLSLHPVRHRRHVQPPLYVSWPPAQPQCLRANIHHERLGGGEPKRCCDVSWTTKYQSMFYFMSVHSKVILDKTTTTKSLGKQYQITYSIRPESRG